VIKTKAIDKVRDNTDAAVFWLSATFLAPVQASLTIDYQSFLVKSNQSPWLTPMASLSPNWTLIP